MREFIFFETTPPSIFALWRRPEQEACRPVGSAYFERTHIWHRCSYFEMSFGAGTEANLVGHYEPLQDQCTTKKIQGKEGKRAAW